MCYVKRIQWEIVPFGLPTVVKVCSKCGRKVSYINTEKFRVNANKNKLDIWLIYQCEQCKTTWNMTVYERITPKAMDKMLYEQFLGNDTSLVKQIAFDVAMHQKNHVALTFDHMDFEVLGDEIESGTVNYMDESSEDYAEKDIARYLDIKIISTYPLNIRIDKILSKKLGISRDLVKKLCDRSIISSHEGINLGKKKASKDFSIQIKAR